MATAPFIMKYCRIDVEKVKKPKAVYQDVTGLNSEMSSEEDIKIGSAATKKKNLTFRVHPVTLKAMIAIAVMVTAMLVVSLTALNSRDREIRTLRGQIREMEKAIRRSRGRILTPKEKENLAGQVSLNANGISVPTSPYRSRKLSSWPKPRASRRMS